MKAKLAIVSAVLLTSIHTPVQAEYTSPVGYVSVTCKAASDTIVGIPLRQSAAATGTLSANPTVNGTVSADLALSGSPGFTTNQFATAYYVKLKSGTGNGQWFQITGNTAGTITVDLNGGSISAVAGDSLEVLKFWTLAELIDPAASTNDPLTTGNAIVSSTGTNLLTRRTEVLIPNLSGIGINLAPNMTFFVNAGIWKEHGQGDINRGSFILWPDSYIVIRHPNAVSSDTTYTVSGEVEMGEFDYPLATQVSSKQDNFIALMRPVDTTLASLNLGGTSAFMTSTGTNLLTRRDELLIYNNAVTGRNKAPDRTYFYYNGVWKKHGDVGAEDRGTETIPAGGGFIIRKYQSGTGATANWNNTSGY